MSGGARVSISKQNARRLVLAGQSLLSPPRRRTDLQAVWEVVEGLGYVQVDSIKTVERAHHTILGVRLDGYRHHHLQRLLQQRKLFEHWTHDASVIPMSCFPHWRHRFERFEKKRRDHQWWQSKMGTEPEATRALVLARIKTEGALPTRAFRDLGSRTGAWWGWSPAKGALEHLWRTGMLMVTSRKGFEKVYDLTERVIPSGFLEQSVTWEETFDWACRSAMQRLVLATPRQVAAYVALVSAQEAGMWCRRHLERVEVEGCEFFIQPGWEELLSSLPEAPDRLRLLSPFDPLVRDRERLARLFDFDYRFEAYVPANQRKYGYYTMPILERDSLVGRVWPRFDARTGKLEVNGPWWEPGVRPSKGRLRKLETALRRLARRIGTVSEILV